MDFKFGSHKLCEDMQSILLKHMHKNIFLFWPTNVEISHITRTKLRGQNPEPRFRVVAYFHIYFWK